MEPSPTGFDSSVHGMTATDRTLEGAAPKVVASQRAKVAATYPVHSYLQLEFLRESLLIPSFVSSRGASSSSLSPRCARAKGMPGMTAADRTQRDLNEADIGREIRESTSSRGR